MSVSKIFIFFKKCPIFANMLWTNFNGECTSRIQNDGKNTKISEWYVKRSWEKEVRGDEYWGT